jgi:hypothetical protein
MGFEPTLRWEVPARRVGRQDERDSVLIESTSFQG